MRQCLTYLKFEFAGHCPTNSNNNEINYGKRNNKDFG